MRLPTVAAPFGVSRLRFSYEYVVGYGRYGKNVPSSVHGPHFTVSIVDAKTHTMEVVYTSPTLDTYDYDTCAQHGGWGHDSVSGYEACTPLARLLFAITFVSLHHQTRPLHLPGRKAGDTMTM